MRKHLVPSRTKLGALHVNMVIVRILPMSLAVFMTARELYLKFTKKLYDKKLIVNLLKIRTCLSAFAINQQLEWDGVHLVQPPFL